MVAEGVNTAVLVLASADRVHLELPICSVIDRVIPGELAPADAYWGLRPTGLEADPG